MERKVKVETPDYSHCSYRNFDCMVCRKSRRKESGHRKGKFLREYAQKENEWASAKTELPKESQPQQEAEAPEEAMEEPSIRVVLMTK